MRNSSDMLCDRGLSTETYLLKQGDLLRGEVLQSPALHVFILGQGKAPSLALWVPLPVSGMERALHAVNHCIVIIEADGKLLGIQLREAQLCCSCLQVENMCTDQRADKARQ